MLTLHPIPAFSDNYIWCIYSTETRKAVVVDPGCAQSVQAYLQDQGLELDAILLTHHHADHTAGIEELRATYGSPVYGYTQATFQGVDHQYKEGDTFELLGTSFRLIEVPGHTLDHIAFYSEADVQHDTPWLFSGDTLFSGGCGRLFEGSAIQMHNSLAKLKTLPKSTLVCCAHEYTLANLDFAQSLMPQNIDLKNYISDCKLKRKKDIPTLPSTIDQELLINPFFRENDQEIINTLAKNVQGSLDTPAEIWAQIRMAKDNF